MAAPRDLAALALFLHLPACRKTSPPTSTIHCYLCYRPRPRFGLYISSSDPRASLQPSVISRAHPARLLQWPTLKSLRRPLT